MTWKNKHFGWGILPLAGDVTTCIESCNLLLRLERAGTMPRLCKQGAGQLYEGGRQC